MARMRFSSGGSPDSLHATTRPQPRAPEHLGDVPPVPPRPAEVLWSIDTYPYPDPKRITAPQPAPAVQPRPQRHRRRTTDKER